MTAHAKMQVRSGDTVYRVEWGLDGRTPRLVWGLVEIDPADHPYCMSGLRVRMDRDNIGTLAAFERTDVEAWATAIAWAHRQRTRLRGETDQWERLYADLVAAQG